MGHHEDSAAPALPELQQIIHDGKLLPKIQGAESLIQKQQLRLYSKSPGQIHPLLHASTKLPRIGVLPSRKMHPLQKILHRACGVGEAHIPCHRGPGDEPGLLKDEPHPGGGPGDAPLGRLQKPPENFKKAGLPTSGLSQKHHPLPRGNLHIPSLKDPMLPETHPQTGDADQRRHGFPFRRRRKDSPRLRKSRSEKSPRKTATPERA